MTDWSADMAWDIWHIAHSDEPPAAQRREIAALLEGIAEDGPPDHFGDGAPICSPFSRVRQNGSEKRQ